MNKGWNLDPSSLTVCKTQSPQQKVKMSALRALNLTSPAVRLVETDGRTERYVCLSHCWGDSKPECVTTAVTLGRNANNVEWRLLPATFRDAIDSTRRLGLRFIWIDSICIIQDNLDDWREQSALMADIYGGAYVTLCATASRNDDGGCYLPSTPDLRSHKLSVQGPTRQKYEIYVETQLTQRRHIVYSSYVSWLDIPGTITFSMTGALHRRRANVGMLQGVSLPMS